MEFLSGLAGWQWALAASVPPAIVALYFLKLRRERIHVSSTLLWKKSVEDLHVNSLWQRLRQNILLWLQLATAAALLFALARPVSTATGVGRRVILLIDQSASMRATDVAPNRLAEAKARARELVDQLGPGDVAMAIAFSNHARVLCPFTNVMGELQSAIDAIEPTDRPTDVSEALAIAKGLAEGTSADDEIKPAPATCMLISDGRFPPVDVPLGDLAVDYIAIGKRGRNLGLVALAGRPSEDQPDKWQVFARVRNSANEAIRCAAELRLEDKLIDVAPLEIPAGAEAPLSFRLSTPPEGALELRLDIDDDLAIDNTGWIAINPPSLAKIVVIGEPNKVLQTALSTGAIEKLAKVNFLPADWAKKDLSIETELSGADLVILDRVTPARMPAANTWMIDALPTEFANRPRNRVEAPAILNWNVAHPVMRFLSLDDVSVAEASVTTPIPGGSALIESDRGDLLLSLPRGVSTDVVQLFPLVDAQGKWKTDWPLRASFPLFILNVIRAQVTESDQSLSINPGDPARLHLASDASRAELIDPESKSTTVARAASGEFQILSTGKTGVYTLRAGASSRRFAVNLLNENESRIEPATSVRLGGETSSDAGTPLVHRREWWKWAAAAGLVLLLVEWGVFHRRVSL